MTISKLKLQLGLAQRAGLLITGDEIVCKAIQGKKARLAFVAIDASDNTKKKFRDKCKSYQVPLIIGLTRSDLGDSIGKMDRVVVAVTDDGFATMMINGLKMMSEVEYIE